MNSTFQQTLKQLSFKTFYRNQLATFGYDDLFADRRVVVFSLTQFRTVSSGYQTQNYIDNYKFFLQHGVDGVYAIDSFDRLICPYIDKKSTDLKGLYDSDTKFVSALAEHYDYQKPNNELSRFWQYVTIINNGEPEKLWHNPFKSDTQLMVLKDNNYRYRKLSADIVLQYLVDNQT